MMQNFQIFAFAIAFCQLCAIGHCLTFDVADVDISNGRFESKTVKEAADLIREHFVNTLKPPRRPMPRMPEKTSKVQIPSLKFETGQVNFDLANLKQGSGFNASVHLGTPVKHGFIAAAMTAYNVHLPLELSPDDFWLLVAFSVSQHLGQPDIAERYRDQFVNHTGKKELIVDIVPYGILPHGDVEINKRGWPNAVRDMMNEITKNTDTNFSSIMTNPFSTSQETELTAFRVALMESTKNYFEYTFGILCGIPQVTLRGTEADYANLVQRIDNLIQLLPDFHWYLGRIRVHAQKLLESVRGVPDVAWWRNMVKVETPFGCGPVDPILSGWMVDWLAYYNARGQLQKVEKRYPGAEKIEIDSKDLDYPAVTLTDVKLKNYMTGIQYPMVFSGGFLGVSQNQETGALRPAIGWLTYYKGDSQPISN